MAKKTLKETLREEQAAFIALYKAVEQAENFEPIIDSITQFPYFGRYVGQNGHYFTAFNPIYSKDTTDLTITFNDEGNFALQYQNEYLKIKFERTPEEAVGMKHLECSIKPRYTNDNLCYIFTYPEEWEETDCRVDDVKLPHDTQRNTEISELLVLDRFKELFLLTLRQDFCRFWLRTRLWMKWY